MPAIRPIQTLEVPGYSGKGIGVAVGSLIRVTDVQGTQIGDVFAVSQKEHSEFLSPSVTRAVHSRLFPKVGDVFWTNAHQPILTFVEDHSPGIHDMLFACCDRQLFEALGVEGYHANCRDNYLGAAAEFGIGHGIVPDPVNSPDSYVNVPPATVIVDDSSTSPASWSVGPFENVRRSFTSSMPVLVWIAPAPSITSG